MLIAYSLSSCWYTGRVGLLAELAGMIAIVTCLFLSGGLTREELVFRWSLSSCYRMC